MPLPRGDEYNQAIQSPNISFSDIELRRSFVETTPLGLPKPYSGGFTTTYRLTSGTSNWAVRCFTREIKDLQKRYQAISNFQDRNNCSFLVNAKYLQDGIKIKGKFFPVIKMKWLNGDPLNLYIEKYYNQKSKIENLLSEFANLIRQLESYGIAHGDLQHGNIIVKGSKLFLIDYDGMFLPDISNLSVNELGHPNFQHPRRTSSDYNKHIDRFSACLIFTALKAISISPSLWKTYNNGDNLLFKGQDFINPQKSQLFGELANHSELQKLTNNLVAVCSLEFSKIPSLKSFETQTIASSAKILPRISIVRSAYAVIDGSQKAQLLEHIGEKVEVVGRLVASHTGNTRYNDPYIFLNIGYFPHQTFTIVVWKEGLATLKKNQISINSLMDKWVSITGVMSLYKGKPQMTLELSTQIQTLSGESEALAKLKHSKPLNPNRPKYKPTSLSKEENVFNTLYRNRPVTPTPQKQYPKSRHSYKPTPKRAPSTSKRTKKSDSGCSLPIIFGIIGASFIGGMFESLGGAFFGFIIGCMVGSWFTND